MIDVRLRMFPAGNVTGLIMGDPLPDRHERAEALRALLPPPHDDERGDVVVLDDLASAVRAGAVATAHHFGLIVDAGRWSAPIDTDLCLS